MSDIKFTYIVLKLLELLIFCIFGYVLSQTKSKKEYWTKASIPILAYAIITGLRFGRWVDWNMYYFRYVNLGQNISSEEYEPLFEWICNILYNIGVPYPGFIMLQCLFFMFTILLIVSNYKKYATFILPLILPLIVYNENYIRWYLAVSFFFLSINSMLNGKTKWMYIWFLCAPLCHSGIILFLPILIARDWLNKHTIDRNIAVSLLFITCFFASISHFTFIISIAKWFVDLGLGDAGGILKYLNSVEVLINGEFGHLGIRNQQISSIIRFFICTALIIWLVKDRISNLHYGTFFYSLFVIGAIVYTPFGTIEIFNRYSLTLYLFSMIPVGLLLSEVLQNRKKVSIAMKSICLICLLLIMRSYVLSIVDLSNKQEDTLLFIWDANGRDFLPYWQDKETIIVQ